MITESVADPRRANWLTISMSEDLCWPEENGTNRPSWELEAEILRLTTRLMMREHELRQVKGQLKTQTRWAEQQVANWRRKMLEKEQQMQLLLVQKDSEMQAIVSQLMIFEAELKQEQSKIENLLKEKDTTIHKQKEEIRRLQTMVNKGASGAVERQMDIFASEVGRNHLVSDVKNRDVSDECNNDSNSKVITFKTENCSVNHQANSTSNFQKPCDHLSPLSCTNVPTNIATSHSASVRHSDDSTNPANCRSSPSLLSSQSVANNTTVVTVGSESRVPLLCNGQSDYRVASTISNSETRISLHTSDESDTAMRKIKDGLIRIRAIQDLTNVRSRPEKMSIPDIRCENFFGEKRRIAHKTPQKMKDLKAKRINMQHRSHRPEFCGQVIL